MSNRYQPSRSRDQRGAQRGSMPRRQWNTWDEADNQDEWDGANEAEAVDGWGDDWDDPPAKRATPRSANRRTGASRPSRAWDDEDERDGARDEWERAARRSVRYRQAPYATARSGYAGARVTGRASGYPAARNGTQRSAPRSTGWVDTVEHWAEASRQWVAAQTQRVFSGEQRAADDSNGWNRAARSGARPAKSTNRRAMLALIGFLMLLPLIGAIQLGVVYAQAHGGLEHFKNAQADLAGLSSHPFDTAAIAQLRAELVSAHSDFTSASAGLERIPGLLGATPLVGSKLTGAQRLLPIAAEAAQVGVMTCDALAPLAPKMKSPFDTTSGVGITADDLKAVSAKFADILPLVDQILTQVSALRPDDLTLDSRLGPAVASVQAKLPEFRQVLTDIPSALALAGTLLGVGQPTTYLLEVLDSTEMRPGGGFIGNYGYVTLSGGHLGGISMKDVDLLDVNAKYGTQVIPIPAKYSWFTTFSRWGFRDSNLDADFPTSAKNGEQLYKLETDASATPVAGVVAITPWLIQSMLKITGPITMTEYNNDQISADNLVDKIHYYQLTDGVPPGSDKTYDPVSLSSLRKRFSGLLFKHFMDTVKAQSAQDMGPLMKMLVNALHTKDLQVYLDVAPAEDILVQTHLGATLDAPAKGDSFFAVDANIIANKSNYVITDALSDEVTIDASGTATHHTTLTYNWPKDPQTLKETYPSPQSQVDKLVQYQRLYVPPNAKLNQRSGWYSTDTGTAFNRQVWSGKMAVTYGNVTTLTADWSDPGVVTHNASGSQYTYLLQRQAGALYSLTLKITLPACAQVAAVPSGFKLTNSHTLTLATEPFTTDTNVTVNYTGC